MLAFLRQSIKHSNFWIGGAVPLKTLSINSKLHRNQKRPIIIIINIIITIIIIIIIFIAHQLQKLKFETFFLKTHGAILKKNNNKK